MRKLTFEIVEGNESKYINLLPIELLYGQNNNI